KLRVFAAIELIALIARLVGRLLLLGICNASPGCCAQLSVSLHHEKELPTSGPEEEPPGTDGPSRTAAQPCGIETAVASPVFLLSELVSSSKPEHGTFPIKPPTCPKKRRYRTKL